MVVQYAHQFALVAKKSSNKSAAPSQQLNIGASSVNGGAAKEIARIRIKFDCSFRILKIPYL